MALVNQTLKLEITPGGVPPVLHVTEYDENMQVVAQLFQRGQYYEIPSGTTAKVEGTLAGHPFSADATVDGSNVTFELTKGMTAYAGRAWTKIKLTKDIKPVSTCGFWLECDRAGVDAGDVIGAPGFEEQIKDAVDEWLDLNRGVTASSPEEGEVFVIVDDSGEVVDPKPEDSRTILYNFDFKQGLTDSVSGVNAVLAGTAIQDADGVHLNGPDDQLKLSFVVSPSTHIEYDLKAAELAMNGNGRLLTFGVSATAAGTTSGFMWRNGNGWAFYTTSGWGSTINAEEKTCMSGKTLTLSFDANLIASLYVNGVFWAKATATFCGVSNNNKHYAFIGSASGSQSAYPVTVSAVRVYDGEYSGGVS